MSSTGDRNGNAPASTGRPAWPIRGFAMGPGDGWEPVANPHQSTQKGTLVTRAIQLHPDGELHLIDVDLPTLGPDEARVVVRRAGVNFWEVLQRRGQVRIDRPTLVGSEGVGVITDCGASVDPSWIGARVAWSKVPGSYAEHIQAPITALNRVPDGISDDTAAGLLFQGATAHYLANDTWPLGDGDTAVVTAAAGGVGRLLVQILAARGVTVVGLASDRSKQDSIRSAGAMAVLAYQDAADELRALVPAGVAGVFDSVGGDLPRELLSALRPRGAMVLYGAASGRESDLGVSDLGAGSYFLTRTAGRDYARTPDESLARAQALLSMANDGAIDVHVGGVWPLADAAQALDALEARTTTGKLLLSPLADPRAGVN
jgi:NADPH2:quinone reductase